jgi:hypothetical protein
MDSVKQLKKIIVQGNDKEIQKLFKQLVKATREEFTEDNEPTLAAFLVAKLYKGFMSTLPPSSTTQQVIHNAMVQQLDDELQALNSSTP